MYNILILTEDYPSDKNKYANSFVHSRNIVYKKSGVQFLVLSFRSKESYEYEGIEVISYNDFKTKYSRNKFNLVLSHAPNLKNHIRFLYKYKHLYKKVIYFIHGHEVLRINKYYPKPYDFNKSDNIARFLIQGVYDEFKLRVLKHFFIHQIKENKAFFVFVSDWMKNEFEKNVCIDKKIINEHSTIIHNNVNDYFLQKSYKPNSKWADVVTIRPLDNPKYGIDIVVKIARSNPGLTFHIYGKGNYFKYNEIPDNVEVFNKFLSHNEIPELLNHYRCALMPTRLDSQGVMMCEMVSYGIPLITSDISICKEMLAEFNNVYFIKNDLSDIDITSFIEAVDLTKPVNKEKFSLKNTVLQEIKVINEFT